jgi:hypothetical protein
MGKGRASCTPPSSCPGFRLQTTDVRVKALNVGVSVSVWVRILHPELVLSSLKLK